MARLSRADTEAALAFSAELLAAAPHAERVDDFILERLAAFTRADVVDYAEVDCERDSGERILRAARYPGPPTAPDAEVWELVERHNPFSAYAARIGSLHFETKRLTDVVDMRAFRRTALHELMGYGFPHDMQTWMPSRRGTLCALELARSGRNFTETEMLFVDAVRPALIAYEAHRSLAQDVSRVQRAGESDGVSILLSVREHEVLDLVAAGLSNTEIARALWISPATVRKHLEHIYAKLDVGNRTAALARTGRTSARSAH